MTRPICSQPATPRSCSSGVQQKVVGAPELAPGTPIAGRCAEWKTSTWMSPVRTV